MKKRVSYCDLLRFFAILSVIMIHVLADFRDEALLNSKPFYVFLTLLDSFTRMGVPIFFMISGIFLLKNQNKEDYKTFFVKRVLKLFIPFFIISIIYYMNDSIVNGSSISIIGFINAFSTNSIKYHLWFMYDIIGIYLLMPFLRKLVNALTKKELLNLIVVIFIMGNCISFVNNLTFNLFNVSLLSSFMFPNLIKYINYLFLGYYLYYYHQPSSLDKKIYIVGIGSILLMPFMDYIITDTLRNDLFLVSGSVLPFLSSLSLFIFVKDNYQKLRIPSWLEDFFGRNADIVFYIYMLHVLVLETIKRNLLRFITPVNALTKLGFISILFVLTVVITFIISYLINLVISFIRKKCQ